MLKNYEKQQHIITQNIFYLSQAAKNITLEDCWNMSYSERDILQQVLEEIKRAEEKQLKKMK